MSRVRCTARGMATAPHAWSRRAGACSLRKVQRVKPRRSGGRSTLPRARARERDPHELRGFAVSSRGPLERRKHTARLVLTGHIIDSMILPQVMDMVMDLGGNFTIEELKVGQHKTDTSICRMEVVANSAEQLDSIVRRARSLGATADSEEPVQLERVSTEGVFPEGFYSTSNLHTEILIDSRWVTVENIEMDCAI